MDGIAPVSSRRAFRALWLLLVLVLPCLALAAATDEARGHSDLRFEHIGKGTALAEAEVGCIFQDRRGYIWFGTNQHGLFRFDGYEIEQFVHDLRDPSSIGSNSVNTIAEDAHGSLWIGTLDGLDRFDPAVERFQHFRHREDDPASIGDDDVRALLLDSAGTFWIGTWKGLNRLVPGPDGSVSFVRFEHDPADPTSLSDNRIWTLVESRGRLVVGLRYGGVDHVALAEAGGSKLAFTHVRHEPDDPRSLSSNDVWGLSVSADGSIWAGSQAEGISRIDLTTGTCTRIGAREGGLSTNAIRSILEDSRGWLWIGVRFEGLQRFDPRSGAFDSYRYDERDATSLSYDRITSMFEDREGLLWFGTWGGGVSRLDPRTERFGLHRHRDDDPRSLSSSQITTVLEDSSGTVWVGTEAGLNRWRAGDGASVGFDRFLARPGDPGSLQNDFVRTLFEARDGTIWIGTRGDTIQTLSRAERTAARPRFSTVDVPAEGGRPPQYLAFAQDPDGSIWFGLRAATLFRWDGTNLERFIVYGGDPASVGDNTVTALLVDSTGTLWVAASNAGLSYFDRSRREFIHLLHAEDDPTSLGSNGVTSIAEDSTGALWVGTTGSGVNRLDRASMTFTRMGKKEGLSSNFVHGVGVDHHDRVWLATSRGLDCLDPRTGSVTHFGESDGLQSNNLTRVAGTIPKGADGRLYVWGSKGLNVFHPDRLAVASSPPSVVLTRLLLRNQAVPIGDDGPLPRDISVLDEITLQHSDYLFGFEFAALSFRAPDKNRYAYKLEGFDDRWIETDANDRKAVFTSVPPGTYTFRVRASNSDGVWNEEGVSIRVVIVPPWWRAWWAYALYLLGIVGIAVAAVQLRLRALKRRSVELEALVERRTAELAESEREAHEAHDHALAEQARAVASERAAHEANQAKSVFLSNMSHELRTPLNAVIGFAQLMARDYNLTREQRGDLSAILQAGEHLLSLINDVLSIAKIEAGKLTFVEHDFDLPVLLRSVEEMMRVRSEAKDLDLVVDLAPDLPRWVRGDDGKLRQVLINLLGNAVKFTDAGTVSLAVRWKADRATFVVADTGPGIAEAELENLFQAFEQTSSGTQAKEGTGLGLMISRAIVQRLGGEIEIESRVGAGTSFTFEIDLPAAERPVETARERRVVGLAPDQPVPRTLVVDDLAENRHLLTRLLQSVGVEVREAANGAEAVEVWRSWRPDLIWMDMRMPVMDGREATRMIRDEETTTGAPRTAIVALTASAFEHEWEGILAAGCDGVRSKPFRESTIFDAMTEHLGTRFLYDEEPAAAAATDVGLAPEHVRFFSPETRKQLADALEIGDRETALAILARAEPGYEAAVEALEQAIRSYQFDQVLSLIETLDAAPS